MQQSNERYEYLAEKWMNGTITPAEKEEFARWYNLPPEEPIVVPRSIASGEVEHRNRMLRRILPAGRRRAGRQQVTVGRRRVVATTVVALVAGVAGLLVWKHSSAPAVPPLQAFNRTLLTLSDGRQLAVEGLSDGRIEQQGVIITKWDSSFLSYSDKLPTGSAIRFNTLTTTRGGNFKVQLSDGSRVWLNSASALRYPTRFSGDTREVYLDGQAYFEVATDSRHPFIVHAGGETVKVLGTSFDVMAYADEPVVRTTLLQGAISVTAGGKTLLLHAGEQTGFRDSVLLRTQPDMEEVAAWKEDRFRFTNTNIKTVMRQLCRWYDVSVDYRGDVAGLNLTGSISRKQSVSELLKAFEGTGSVQFEVADTTIIVEPR